MPWVRIDDNAIDHPKFIALSANAWRLWCEGMTYCQKHLTDGFLPRSGVRGMRYYSAASLKMLLAVLVPGKGPLWHDAEGGYQVHDYHDWNDSRETVIQARQDSKDRRQRWKNRRANGVPDASGNASSDAYETPNGVRGVEWSGERKPSERREGGAGETAHVDAIQRLVARHEELHREYCGVGYIGNPMKDYQAAAQLVRTFPDPNMQDAILTFGLNDADPFMAKDTRTIAKIASRASGYAQTLKARKLA